MEEEREYKKVTSKVLLMEESKTKIIDDILYCSEDLQIFDDSFVVSVKKHLKKFGEITDNQYNALVDIYYKYEMDNFY